MLLLLLFCNIFEFINKCMQWNIHFSWYVHLYHSAAAPIQKATGAALVHQNFIRELRVLYLKIESLYHHFHNLNLKFDLFITNNYLLFTDYLKLLEITNSVIYRVLFVMLFIIYIHKSINQKKYARSDYDACNDVETNQWSFHSKIHLFHD